MSPAIAVNDLVRHFGEHTALGGVSLELAEGRTLGVFGSNGAGKSTLVRVLAGLLRPHAGRVRVLGAELPREGWKAHGKVGLVGHEPLLYLDLSPRRNLEFGAKLHGISRARVDEVLGSVGLETRADEPLRELSRGLVQRAAVARAVLHDPPLLLLDEARASLDPAAVDQLEPLIGRSSGRTRVIVTHDVERGLAESDVVLALRAGRVDWLGPASGTDEATLSGLYR